ncbi:MAG: ABC transporter permease [Bacteroidia bacterium]|nr:ABC transporter permease [Bacteroidia bacterium]
MYILSRLLQGIGVIWGIVTLLFVIFYALGDPTDYLVEDNADAATRAAVRAKYGLDQPLPVRYFTYLNGLSPIGWADSAGLAQGALGLVPLRGGALALKWPDLGRSYQSQAPVGALIAARLGGTAWLGLSSLLFAALAGIPLGVAAALRRDTWADRSILTLSVLGVSAPSFFVGVLVAWLFSVVLGPWTGLPVSGYLFEEEIFGTGSRIVWAHLLLPALALGIRPLAVLVQLTRSSMLDVLSLDYIRSARAKGLPPRRVYWRHALRNALNPVITSLTGWLASLLAGAFFIEYIFDWQGIGKLTIDALNTNDFPVILGCAACIGTVFVLVHVLTDLLYALTDPRIRLR